MARERVEQLVTRLVEEIIAGHNMELVDVEFIREREWILRVLIHKPGGIGVDDCQWVSEQLGKKLDAMDPIPQAYFLEVSSPGLDRPLKKKADFDRHKGDLIEVHTYSPNPVNGKKVLIGRLEGLVEETLIVECNGQMVHLPREKVSQVRLHISF